MKRGSSGEWIHVGVTDNGSGMAEETQRRAFEVFFTTKPRGLGTGLGLALVRKVVLKAGGHMELKSKLDKGTSVIMVVPAAARESRAKNSPMRSSAVTLKDGRAAGLIAHMLAASGAPVLDTSDSASAQIWVVDPKSDLAKAKAWHKSHPGGVLVLFGEPPPRIAAAWKALAPIVITDPDDFEAIRTAISQAIERT